MSNKNYNQGPGSDDLIAEVMAHIVKYKEAPTAEEHDSVVKHIDAIESMITPEDTAMLMEELGEKPANQGGSRKRSTRKRSTRKHKTRHGKKRSLRKTNRKHKSRHHKRNTKRHHKRSNKSRKH
jgi:hypothetical protein